MNVISVRHFTKIYRKGITAADDVCFDVEKGSLFGLLGPNGAGKSTVIRYLAGLIHPDRGSLTLFENPTDHQPKKILHRIGFVLDHPVFIEKLTVGEYLNFVGSLFGIHVRQCRHRIETLLNRFSMTDRKHTRIEQLSSGMKKRVSLMSALIHGPDLLVLDEPFEDLDPVMLRRVECILNEFLRKGKTVLFTTHRTHLAQAWCNKILVMDQGRIIHRFENRSIRDTEGRPTAEKSENLIHLMERLIPSGDKLDGMEWL